MLKRISIVALAVSLCSISFTTYVAAAPTVSARPVVSTARISFSPPAPKTYSPAPVKTVKAVYTPSNNQVRRTQSGAYRPVATNTPGATSAKKKKSKQAEYDYYPFEDCQRYTKVGFNGWKCLDND